MNTTHYSHWKRVSSLLSHKIIRIGLALFVLLSRSSIAGSIVFQHATVHATSPQATTITNPWGLALDGNRNIFVAEPGCDASPVCSTPPPGYIGMYAAATNTFVNDYLAPKGVTPVFVAVDGTGTVWFTDSIHNLIGSLVPTTGQYTTYPVPTTDAEPYDLVVVNNNIWFTEFRTNQIGFFNTTTHQFVETRIPTANATPYGITVAANGAVWFAENNQAIAQLGSFKPTANGVIAIVEHPTQRPGAHLLASDSQGNIFFSAGSSGYIGELSTAGSYQEFFVSKDICTNPSACSGTDIAGIAVDKNNQVVFDDSLSARVGVLNPATGTFAVQQLPATSRPRDGLLIDTDNNVWVSEQNGLYLDEYVAGTLTQSTISIPAGPVNMTWNFAEGRVGRGFREYLTIENPNTIACHLTIIYQYTMEGTAATGLKTVSPTIPANTRLTESVNADLGIADSVGTAAALSVVVKASGCPGVVAERPMYFSNYHGLSSGTVALGTTHLSTSFAFADIPTGAGTLTFLTILNPGATAAHVRSAYYAHGQLVGVQTVTAVAYARSTIYPGAIALSNHVAAVVSSDQPIIVERPTYFINVHGASGAADVVGATPGKGWLFAEGYAAANSQETLSIANVDPAQVSATVTVTLESKSGAKQSYVTTVGANSQLIWSVNAHNTFSGASPEVSAQVSATGANIVVQREMYFQYHHTLARGTLQANCITDVMGMPATNTKSSYSFAEGYTNNGYNTWLTIQNPSSVPETVYVSLVNGQGQKYVQSILVAATSRATIDVTNIEQSTLFAGNGPRAINPNSISITVQTRNNGGTFLAERPEYFNTARISSFVVQGGTDIVGYEGG